MAQAYTSIHKVRPGYGLPFGYSMAPTPGKNISCCLRLLILDEVTPEDENLKEFLICIFFLSAAYNLVDTTRSILPVHYLHIFRKSKILSDRIAEDRVSKMDFFLRIENKFQTQCENHSSQ